MIRAEEYDEKNLSTQQYQAQEDARFSGEDEHKKWSERLEEEASKGQKEVDSLTLGILGTLQRSDPCFLPLTCQHARQTGTLTIAMKGAFGFSKKERITHPQDFRKTMKFGKRLNSKSFILFLQNNQSGFHRAGIVVKKEVGPATYRNRIRRYIREFFRLHKHQIKGSFDIVFLVKKETSINRYLEAEKELRRCIISSEQFAG